MPQPGKAAGTANMHAVMDRLEKTAMRIEKELERQLKALEGARVAMREEARKQLAALRKEQRGFLMRMRAAAAPARKPAAKKPAAKKPAAKKAPPKKAMAKKGPPRKRTARKAVLRKAPVRTTAA